MEGWQHLMALREAGLAQNALRQRMRQRRREIRAITEPFGDMSEADFVKLYRLPQRVVRELIVDIRPAMSAPERSSAISVESKVLCALSFFATGSYQRAVGQDFCLAMSQPLVSRSLHEVISAINQVLLHRWIKFPIAQGERNLIKQRFHEATGIPGTIGAIDCTHIAILKPVIHEEHYLNRKQYHSINVQAVCDYDLRLLTVNPRYPGSTADAFVWRNSTCKGELARRYAAGERGEWLIGDSGYANEPWLLMPILDAVAGSPEENYTNIHCRSRCCIERCFGVLKARWRCLLSHRCLHYDPHTARQIIMACAVLHNMAINARLPHPEPLGEEEAVAERALEAGDAAPNPIDIDHDFLGHARAVRAQVVGRLWQAAH